MRTPPSQPESPAGATRAAVPLLDLPVNAPARLCQPATAAEPPAWLVSLGFVPGTRLRIIRSAPLGGPVEIELRGTRVCVRRADLAGFLATFEDRP